MLKKVLLGLVLVLVALAAAIASRPADFKIERSMAMAAPAEVPYGLIADFHKWTDWSPWEGLDPSMKRTYEGAPAANGSVYTWVGNKDVGEGRMTITSAKAPSEIDIKLEFLKPFAATNRTLFTIKGTPEKSEVSWRMEGKRDFMMKAFSLFVDMDKMVGADFEKGLTKLKTVAEAEAKKQAEEKKAQAAAEAAAEPQPAN